MSSKTTLTATLSTSTEASLIHQVYLLMWHMSCSRKYGGENCLQPVDSEVITCVNGGPWRRGFDIICVSWLCSESSKYLWYSGPPWSESSECVACIFRDVTFNAGQWIDTLVPWWHCIFIQENQIITHLGTTTVKYYELLVIAQACKNASKEEIT